jgi:tetratricopeptide (TPR) repeat protein
LSIAELYASLGNLSLLQKDYFNSKICFDKEFDIYFKLFGNDHPNVGLSCKNLGVVEKEMGNFDKSKILLNKAFENIKKNYGLNHSEIAEILLELGKLEQKSNVLKSIEIFKNAINITEKIEGDFSENKGDLLYQMAVSYSLVENEEKTILFSDSCIKTFEKVYNSKKHPKIIDAFLLISKSYIKQKKLSEALLFCNQGINLCFEKKPKFPEDLYNKNILFEFSVIKGMQLKTEILKTQNTNPKLGLVFAKDGLVFAQRLLQSLNSNEAQTEMLFLSRWFILYRL